jgi:hypothetical protein
LYEALRESRIVKQAQNSLREIFSGRRFDQESRLPLPEDRCRLLKAFSDIFAATTAFERPNLRG